MYKNINNEVIELIYKLFGILIVKDYAKSSLTGNDIGLDGTCLIYLFYELEKKFNIKFLEDDIKNYKLNTLDNIVKIIATKIQI